MSADARCFWKIAFRSTLTVWIAVVGLTFTAGYVEDQMVYLFLWLPCSLPYGMAIAYAWPWVSDWVVDFIDWVRWHLGRLAAASSRASNSAAGRQ